MKHEGVGRLEAQPRKAAFDLRGERLVEMVDLVDHEHALAPACQRSADDFLAVAVFVAGRGVDDIEAGVHRPPHRRDALLQRDGAVGNIADAQDRGLKTRPTEEPAGLKCHVNLVCSHNRFLTAVTPLGCFSNPSAHSNPGYCGDHLRHGTTSPVRGDRPVAQGAASLRASPG